MEESIHGPVTNDVSLMDIIVHMHMHTCACAHTLYIVIALLFFV